MLRTSTRACVALFTFIVLIQSSEQTLIQERTQRDVGYAPSRNNVSAPGIPRNFVISNRGSYLGASWSKPSYTNGTLGGYLLQWSLQLNRASWSQRVYQMVPNNILSYNIFIDSRVTGWDVILTAYNRFPNGTLLYGPSSYINYSPYGPQPANPAPSACRNVVAKVKSKSIEVSWQQPSNLNANGGYVLQFSLRNGKTWSQQQNETLSSTAYGFTISAKNKFQGFDIYIWPFNRLQNGYIAWGPYSRISGASGMLASFALPSLMAILTMVFFNKP